MPKLRNGRSYHFDDCVGDGVCVACGRDLEFGSTLGVDLSDVIQARCCHLQYVLKPSMVVVEHQEVDDDNG